MSSGFKIGLAFSIGIALLVRGLVSNAGAQQQPEIASCHVQQGDRTVHEDKMVAIGSKSLGECARAVQAGSGVGTWGPYEIEIHAGGMVHLNGEEVGVLRELHDRQPVEGSGPGRS